MEVRFEDDALDALEVGPGDGGYPAAVVKGLQKTYSIHQKCS